ncbi:transcription factor GTE7-like [Oryza brachyantha]|uniref:transcription factor GTE7-like n=1 Tax=Oryza brachyantha TaxID=4533 RepID=UPI001ADB5E20|nr:transcription factor GTE7-like [Oryza brachyantha]
MTSAVLAGRNEVHHHHPHWGGDARVPLVPKHATNPNPRRHRPSPGAPGPPPAPPRPQVAPSAADPSPSGHVTIRPSEMSRREAQAVRARLTGELSRVRALLSHIERWEDQRRPAAAPATTEPPQQRGHVSPPPALQAAMRKRCTQILTRLRKQKISVWFNSPVDVERLKLHDYHAIIRNPMDLGTVKENLAFGRYPSHDAFAADVRLTFNNALRYNPPDHHVHRYAGNLLATFEGLYKEAVSWFEEESQRLQPPMPLALPPPPQPPVPVPVQAPPRIGGGGRRPKPKAREPNKREMSEEEKHKLRVEIGNLPEEKMVNVLQIVQKRNTDPALMGEVVELDFDEMDVETLWELDRFVVNCKKALNKSRRTVVVNGGVVDATTIVPIEDDAMQVNVHPRAVVDIGDSENDMTEKRVSEVDMVDEYVDIGDEMPTANYQSVEIERDAQVASSSSGSESGSSASSDSDSRSSGDSDSDGDDAQSPN